MEINIANPFEIETVTIRTHGYKHYKAKHPDGVEVSLYKKIVYSFIKSMMKDMLDGYEIQLYERLGVMLIMGSKIKPVIDKNGNIKGVAPDWGATKKLQASDEEARKNRTIVYCFNEHSNGIRYEYIWNVDRAVVRNRTFYSFTRSWHNRRELVRRIKEEGAEYQVRIDKEEN